MVHEISPRKPLGIFLALFGEHLADTHRGCVHALFPRQLRTTIGAYVSQILRVMRPVCNLSVAGIPAEPTHHYCTNCHSQSAEKR